MRNLLIIISLLSCLNVFSQEDFLQDTDWYLQYIEIDGIQEFVPASSEFDNLRIFFNFDENVNVITMTACKTGTIEFGGEIDNSELVLLSDFTFSDESCSESPGFEYENSFFDFFSENLDDEFSITTAIVDGDNEDGCSIVEIVNENGDILFFKDIPAFLNTNTYSLESTVIYPNPTQNDLKIITDKYVGEYGLKIYNLNGKVYTQNLTSVNSIISLDGYPSGVYFLEINDFSGNVVTKKIIKE